MFILTALVGGFLLLYIGAEALVRGGATLAFRLGLTPLFVGLTVVAFGTSSPELVVSLQAALQDAGDIALGNIVGSNIANIALILGCTAVIRPMSVKVQLVRFDVPLAIACSLLLPLLLYDGTLGRIDGMLLVVGIVAYVGFSLYQAKRETAAAQEAFADVPTVRGGLWLDILLVVAGLAMLVGGGTLFIRGAVELAGRLGISQAVIGLTVVAVGTSLPELATSVVASIKGEGDLAIGNVVGSNIFNILSILGLVALVAPIGQGDVRLVDLGVMIGLVVLLLPLIRTGFRLVRWEGVVLLTVYVTYIYTLLP